MNKYKRIDFDLKEGKKVKLRFYESPEYKNLLWGGWFTVKVGAYFFDKFDLNEQRVIVWHELYHAKHSLFNWLFDSIRLWFDSKKIKLSTEFRADKFAASNCGRENTLKFLRKIKEFYQNGVVKYNSKTHPPIDERIKRVESFLCIK